MSQMDFKVLCCNGLEYNNARPLYFCVWRNG